MAVIEQRLVSMGLELPEPLKVREGLRMSFAWVRVRGKSRLHFGSRRVQPGWNVGKTHGKSGLTFRRSRITPRRDLLPPAHLASLKRVCWQSRSGCGLVACLRHGECCSGFQRDAAGYKWLFRSDTGALRPDAGAHARSSIGMAIL